MHDTGESFAVLTPTGSLAAGSQRIEWRVAGTDQAPINCSQVDIAYTNNLGQTFTDLLRNTPNDGNATVQLGTSARHIRVKCSDNIFFALSGTAPRVAGYRNDNGQSSGGDLFDNNSDSSGGGGSLPLELILLGGLLSGWRLQQWRKAS
ncbi:MAG: hypothetical protein R3E95_03935 [Thiolinea sp.]